MTPERRDPRRTRVTRGTSRAEAAALPHERDQAPEAPQAPTRPMRLAWDDVEHGRVDTDCRGSTPAAACDRELPALLKPAPVRPQRSGEPHD